jgi:hypothetical protein
MRSRVSLHSVRLPGSVLPELDENRIGKGVGLAWGDGATTGTLPPPAEHGA